MELDEWLEFVKKDDDLGILKVKPKTSSPTADEHLLAKFNEINEFISAHGREPEPDTGNVPEFMLFQRLKAMRGNDEQNKSLIEHDVHGILRTNESEGIAEPQTEYEVEPEPKEINSLDDIFEDDALGLLSDSPEDIFNLKHVSKERAESDHISRRKKCKDFDQYEDKLKQAQEEIKQGKRLLRMFADKGEALVPGCFYVMHGILLYLESVDISSEEKTVSGKRFRKDGRTRCIFENGTESNMLYRSLAKELYKDGKIVSDTNESLTEEFYNSFQGIGLDDQASGYIYILQSLSTNPEINSINNLYKIGYATTSVQKRIANAENEPTYLMASVYHVSSYKCFNMNAQKFENLLHTFFGKACLDVEIADSEGKMCNPREWFIAPLSCIEMAIQLLINGEIVRYRYDPSVQSVVEKKK